MIKKLFSVLLCAVLCTMPLFGVSAGNGAVRKLTDPADVMKIVIIERSSNIPVRIAPVTLERGGESVDAYLVCMLGVKDNKAQVNKSENLFPAAFNLDNSYSDFVKKTVLENIPEGSSLIMAGHSLGGMVAQHLRQDKELIEKYDLINVMTAGSPLILTKGAVEGTLNRLADTGDFIPWFSPATIVCPLRQIKEAHRENGGFNGDPDGAHNESYLLSSVWGGYDALGAPGGDAVISIDPSAIRNFGVA